MEILVLILAMIVVGVLIAALAGVIWGPERPLGLRTDYLASVATAVAVGLLDWFVIPAMGFSDTLKLLGVIAEPPLASLLVLWLIRRARRT
jgi:hypothetical protein